jgi:hypothetical protein
MADYRTIGKDQHSLSPEIWESKIQDLHIVGHPFHILIVGGTVNGERQTLKQTNEGEKL